MKEEKLESRGVVANDLLDCPIKSSSAAYGSVWVPFDCRLANSHQYPSHGTTLYLYLHLQLALEINQNLQTLSLCFWLCLDL